MKTPYKYLAVMLSIQFLVACSGKPKNTNGTTSTDTEVEEQAVYLFNGKDLSGWYTYQRQPEPTSDVVDMAKDAEGNYTEPIGLNNDPLQVFTVVEEEGEPAIRISGETFGILVTHEEFENYHLKLQFKWGEKKYPPRVNEKKDSGILYHSIGAEGAWGGVWMKSLECQVQETDCGDYISVDTVFADVPALYNEEDNKFYYTPDADPLTFSHERSYCNKSADFEKPMGEWNTMEIYTYDGNSVHVVNGMVNNRVYNARFLDGGVEVPLTKGKIQLQSEGAEIFYRNISIEPITSIPESVK
jgi:hypothetical protein